MGLFNIFKKPIVIQDDFFGRLRYMDFKDPAKGYFEGNGFFSSIDGETEYLINADATGPTNSQREFYINLQKQFDSYIEMMKPLIEDEFRNWKEDFEIKNFKKEFNLVCVTIPRLDSKPLVWDMSFTTTHDLNHHVTIDFIGDIPNGILIDG